MKTYVRLFWLAVLGHLLGAPQAMQTVIGWWSA